MRKQVLVGVVCLILSGFICAQDMRRAPIVEVFGGYSLVHSRGRNMSGWSAAATTNVLPWLGITADFTGHYFGQTYTQTNLPPWLPSSLTFHEDFNLYGFLFGPQVSYRRPRMTVFAHALFGTTHGSVIVQSLTPGVIGGTTVSNDYTVAYGGGVDINISRRFALRPLQADYLFTRNGILPKNSFRYSGGVVFRFGTR